MATVLLTVPHAMCAQDSPEQRTCDRAALRAAVTLSNELRNEGYWPIVWANTQTARSAVDMNRAEARLTPWRRELDHKLGTMEPHLLFDVHSFPRISRPGKHSFYNPLTEVAPDVVILTNPVTDDKNEILLFHLRQHLTNTKILRGSVENDIMVTATWDNAVPSLLLEFREDLTNERLRERADETAVAVKAFSERMF
jgi:hypothetical protein